MLWAPREFELFRLMDNPLAEGLLWHYLQRAPVAESFIWRRWLYVLGRGCAIGQYRTF